MTYEKLKLLKSGMNGHLSSFNERKTPNIKACVDKPVKTYANE
jgi:hypothetical protein